MHRAPARAALPAGVRAAAVAAADAHWLLRTRDGDVFSASLPTVAKPAAAALGRPGAQLPWLYLREHGYTCYGSAHYGSTYYGSIYHGTAHYGSTYYGATYYGSAADL